MGLWSRFSSNSNKQLFHSSGVLGDNDAETLGTTSAETFEQRQQVNRNRQLVGSYRDAGVLHNYRKEAHDTKQKDDDRRKRHHYTTNEPSSSRIQRVPSSRIDIVKSSRKTPGGPTANGRPGQGITPPVSRPSFQEPSSRRFNPYQ